MLCAATPPLKVAGLAVGVSVYTLLAYCAGSVKIKLFRKICGREGGGQAGAA